MKPMIDCIIRGSQQVNPRYETHDWLQPSPNGPFICQFWPIGAPPLGPPTFNRIIQIYHKVTSSCWEYLKLHLAIANDIIFTESLLTSLPLRWYLTPITFQFHVINFAKTRKIPSPPRRWIVSFHFDLCKWRGRLSGLYL